MDPPARREVLCQICHKPVPDRRRKVCSMDCAARDNPRSVRRGGIKRDSQGNEIYTLIAQKPDVLSRPPPAAPSRVRFSSLADPPRPDWGAVYRSVPQGSRQQDRAPPPPLTNRGPAGPPPFYPQPAMPSNDGQGGPAPLVHASQQQLAGPSVPSIAQHGPRAYDRRQQALGAASPNYSRQVVAPSPHNGNTIQGGEPGYGLRSLSLPLPRRLPLPVPRPQFDGTREYPHSAGKDLDDENTEEEIVKFFSTHRLRGPRDSGVGDGPAGKGDREDGENTLT
ncbi:hypothetical protein F5Y14DRAFT_460294 [Nemania sp. NC0429]|nr:hypothetical protein F5Y14DRAFT_460294 [Nemania sp. NC0429]